jgi:hypothetical protein
MIKYISKGKTIKDATQAAFDFFMKNNFEYDDNKMKQNRRCKKGTVNPDTFECPDKEKETPTKKKSAPKVESNEVVLRKIINGEIKKGAYETMTSIFSKMSPQELKITYQNLDTEMKNFKNDFGNPESRKAYERLAVVYGTAYDMTKEMVKGIKEKNKSSPIKYEPFSDIEGAMNSLGTNVSIVGKVSKVKSIQTLNMIAEERARLYNQFPQLQKIDINEYKIDDEKLNNKRTQSGSGVIAAFDGSDNSITFLSDSASRGKNAARSKGSNAKNVRYGVRQLAGTYLNDFYRHELGHAAEEQLLTHEEIQDMHKSWERVGRGGFGASELHNEIEQRVSEYAASSPNECFAEMFNMATSGTVFDEKFYPEMVKPLNRILSNKKSNSIVLMQNMIMDLELNYSNMNDDQKMRFNEIKLNYKCETGAKNPGTNECPDTGSDFKDKKSAAEFAFKNITNRSRKVDANSFRGLPQDFVNTLVDSVYKAQIKYNLPKLDWIGAKNLNKKNVASYSTTVHSLFGMTLPGATQAITLNPKNIEADMEHTAVGTTKGVVNHEIGHYIIEMLGYTLVGTGDITEKVFKSGNVMKLEGTKFLNSAIDTAYNSISKEDIKKYISLYAAKDVREFGAEVFSKSENQGWSFIDKMPNKKEMENIKECFIKLEAKNYRPPVTIFPKSPEPIPKPKPKKSEQVGFDQFN